MSTENNQSPQPALKAESQVERWLKYGSNVVLSIIIVIVLGAGLIWLAQMKHGRIDTTDQSSLSLKPQTVNVLDGLKQKITLVSLYARPTGSSEDKDQTLRSQADKITDLLDEYRTKSSNIDVRVIDPLSQKDKLEALHQEFLSRYGGQIQKYKDFIEAWKKDVASMRKLTDAESAQIARFDKDVPGAAQTPDDQTGIADFVRTVRALSKSLIDAEKAIDKELRRKHPDYKAASEAAKEQMDRLSKIAGGVVDQAPKVQQAPDTVVSPDFKKYLGDATPRYQQIKKLADDSVAKAGKLGELKIDQLEDALNVENPILVLGETEWRILTPTQIWQSDPDIRSLTNGAKVRPRFAGEQQITTAIYSLENPKKRKVCFVRPSGPALTSPGFMGLVRGGPLSTFAERLREYNFEVSEKDLSGMSAMQQQQMPQAPEPSDEEIKDAIWICVDFPMNEQMQQQMPNMLPEKLKQHLDHGGSALVLSMFHGDKLTTAMASWGIEIKSELLAVHEQVKVNDSSSDFLEMAKGQPNVFDVKSYGDSLIGQPVRNLDAVIVSAAPIAIRSAPNVTSWPLFPLTDNATGIKTWGSANFEEDSRNQVPLSYKPDKGDMAPPIYAGAVAEKKDGGRLVVFGALVPHNQLLSVYDPKLAQREPPIIVNEFPGNAEISTNAVLWLAKLDSMIAISPTAMDVPRIADVPHLDVVRIGVLLVLLPGLVIAAGVAVYLSRRE